MQYDQTILLITEPRDYHGLMMKMALEEKGAHVDSFSMTLFPQADGLTIAFDGESDCSFLWGGRDKDYDAVINRRVAHPHIGDMVAACDHSFSASVCYQMATGMLGMQSSAVFSVNDYQASVAGQFKARQLACAQQVGLKIPKTLFSNNADEVVAFFAEDEEIIFKNLQSGLWVLNETEHVSAQMISQVDRADVLQHAEGLQYGPGIFQAKINKAFELRVVVMGHSLFCMRLNSQDFSDTTLDWRMSKDSYPKLCGGAFVLPEAMRAKLIGFMENMGLVFGCIDLIVTPEGDFIFLEVNEMGQFLWMEEVDPWFTLLDAFSDFVLSGNSAFAYHPNKNCIPLSSLAGFSTEDELSALFGQHFPEPIAVFSPYVYSEAS